MGSVNFYIRKINRLAVFLVNKLLLEAGEKISGQIMKKSK